VIPISPEAESFTISEAEIRKTRRGAFLPALVILPMACMFGIDSSKSQPMHFLMTISIGIIFAAAVVSVSWYGAKKTIAEYGKSSLTIRNNRLIWKTGTGVTELDLESVEAVTKKESRGDVQSITLRLADGGIRTLEGYDRMNVLFESLANRS